ncbi:hypothetical protein C8Q75DRAFT_166657 [Abortiporus biennis]|nr:hypothetical protein C8Q75DRAFT_166657 [Abortiporus biennis]
MYEDARVGVEPVDWSQLDLFRFASLKKLMLNMRYALLGIYQPESILDGRGRLLCRYPAELISTISRTVQDINILICLSDEEVETTPCNLHRSRSTSAMEISDIQYKLPRLCSILEIVDLKDFEGFEDEEDDA